MLPLLKKSPDNPSGSVGAAWHPDFRDLTALPDTKVVRTSFFVNGAAVLAFLCVGVFVAYQEYTISLLDSQLRDVESRFDRDAKPSAQALALYKEFQAAQAKLAEAELFTAEKTLVVTEFMAELGNTVPKSVALTLVDIGNTGVILRGAVQAPADQASGVASEFEKMLKENRTFGATFGSVNLTSIVPDSQNGKLSFEISMKFTGAAGAKKP